MKSFWAELYDSAKDRRYGTLYLLASVVVAGICLGIAFFEQLFLEMSPEGKELAGETIGVVTGILLVGAVARGVMALRTRRRARRETNYSRLSSDELAKARSKLMKNRNRNGG
jgi:formate hydrogenlyase subunit 3/multisubunit Na+/H+ antiporter MnhD subunit